MKYAQLEKNLIEVLKEEQIKLSYRSEIVRLYYPLSSLNRLLEAALDAAGMEKALCGFADHAEKHLGRIAISRTGERFCLQIPPEGVDYVHAHLTETEFISDFIHTIEKHGCTIEEALQVFYKHSAHVHVEKITNGEFDYLIYFADGVPDDFRYCLKDEGCHIIYHRFTEGDYEEFGF